MPDVIITVTENGPYKVEGPIEVLDQDGFPIEVDPTPVYLCRCGRSQNKPFCDGTHARVGFNGARTAVLRQEAA
jgi:CDGSH-type Zn-finger protein